MQSIPASSPALAPPLPGAFADRKPPFSIEAEMSVLGGMFIDPDAVVRAVEILDDSMFHREAHRRLFRAMVGLWERGQAIDPVTLSEHLKNSGDFDAVGGAVYLAQLLEAVPTAANLEYHARIVREKSLLRRLIEAATGIIQSTFEGQADVDKLLDEAESKIFQVAQTQDRKGFVWIKELLWPAMEQIELLSQNSSAITGVPTGFLDLDNMTAGFQKGDLIIVAARPSMGKCLAFDSEIVLEDGSIATMEELFRRREARLLTLDEGMKLRITEPSAFVDDGVKPVFRVTTRLGRAVEATAPHPFLTVDGWRRLDELSVGESIGVPLRLDVFGTGEMRECEIRLLACVIGGGSPMGSSPESTAFDRRIQEDFAQAIETFRAHRLPAPTVETGATAAAHWNRGVTVPMPLTITPASAALDFGSSTPASGGFEAVPGDDDILSDWLAELGVGGCRPATMFVPPRVFALRRELIALFLNRFFVAHGLASAPGAGQAQIAVACESERLARQVQHLLLRFGVVASFHERWTEHNGARRQSWLLRVTDARSIVAFAHEIGIFGQGEALRRVVNESGVDHPGGPAECDVYWDDIVSIEPMGRKQVYDLTIPSTHNFVANDICVHNTAFTLNIAQHAAISAQKSVAFFSLEMSKESLVQRMLTSEARVDAGRVRTGRLRDDDYPRLAQAAGLLNTAPIYVDDTPAISILEMRAKARRLKSDRPDLALVVVDYLQLMQSGGKVENRQQEVSEISRGLKALAKELELPVVALSQLSRAVESRPDKRPMMSDLRESGAIEQDADLIMFLYRPEYYLGPVDKDGNSLEGRAEVIIGKQRNGATGTISLMFHKEFTRFESFSYRNEDGG